jgi:hypothetical protein
MSRFPTKHTLALALALGIVTLALHAQSADQNTPPPTRSTAEPPASGQAPPTHAVPTPGGPGSAAYSGCVMASPTDKDTLILNSDLVCADLSGKFATPNLAGHQIDLSGVLTPRAGTTPASIAIDSVDKIGKSCSEVCSPLPPRSRGLGGERPGREGGRPGATTTPPTPQ